MGVRPVNDDSTAIPMSLELVEKMWTKRPALGKSAAQ
jgi:hypothetical protein